MHRHQHEDETLLLLEGELDLIVDGASHRVLSGHTLVLPRGTEHQIINRVEQTARYLVICTPAGFDRFVDACADAQPGPVEAGLLTDVDKARMQVAATQFGITLIPPPRAR